MLFRHLNQSANRINKVVEGGKGENQLVRVISQIALLQLVNVENVVAGVRDGCTEPVVDRGDTNEPVEWNLQL